MIPVIATIPTDRIQGTRFYQSYLVAAEPIILDGEVIGEICLISDLLDPRERIVQYVGVVASGLFASLLVAFVISSRLQRMISGPISHLARNAGAVSVGRDYTIRATRHGSDELGTLIDGFNEMLGQIQERDAKLQRARDELEARVEGTKALQEEIAERSRIEDALRHSEEHFRSLIENGSDMISVVDLDGTIRYASPSVERVLGYKPDEMIGRILSEFTHPDDVSAASSSAPESMSRAQWSRESFASGTRVVIGGTSRCPDDSAGRSGPAQIIINSRDITERKTRTGLRIWKVIAGLLEGSLNPMRLTDAEGNVVLVNDAYCKLIERPREVLEGCLLTAAYLAERHDRILEKHRERFRSRSLPPNVESEVELWNGKKLFLEVSFSFLSRFEDAPLLLSVFRDVTQRKQAEE